MSLHWLALLALIVGCQRASPTPSERASPTPPPPEAVPTPGQALEAAPLSLGPSPAGTPLADREHRLEALLTGQTPTERLPLRDTNAGAPYDSQLFVRLTTEPITPGTAETEASPAIRVELRVGSPTLISGALDLDRAKRVTAGMRAGFRNCYVRALTQDARAPRRLSFNVRLHVNADGTVESAEIEGKQPPRVASMFTCIRARAAASQLEASGSSAQLRFSVDAHSPASTSL